MYTVLARKYRPQTFDEVMGQEHITTTLTNAINDDKVGHAYLFCGPRGVGKTSMARILAKSLNCRKGISPSPCCRCENCLAIAEGTDVDVVEIDAASNRSIDDARELRESVQYAPLRSRFKIYIMDESHMLTKEAFNALLKTLEEPPAHIKFIFATTDLARMPDTIASRCQRFDFHRVTTADIRNRLKQICSKEKIEVAEASLAAVARVSGGAMRDAQSLLDQFIAFKGASFTPEDVGKMLGTATPETCHAFLRHAKNGASREMLGLIDKLFNDGADPGKLLEQLSGTLRNLLVVKTCPDNRALLDVPDDEERLCREGAAAFTVEHLLYAMQIVFETRRRVKEGVEPRVAIEVAALKLCRTPDVAGVSELLERIKSLETTLSAKPFAVPRQPAPAATPAPQPTANGDDGGRVESPAPPPVESTLSRIIQLLKERGKNSIAAFLKEGRGVDLPDGGLEIRFAKVFTFHKGQVEQPANHKEIEEALVSVRGKRAPVRVTQDAQGAAPAVRANEIPEDDNPPPKSYNTAVEDPSVRKILETFDGKIVSVEESR